MKRKIKKTIINLYKRKNRFNQKLYKLINPSIVRWNKKAKKRTNGIVTIANPLGKQKGGVYVPRRKRLQYRHEL